MIYLIDTTTFATSSVEIACKQTRISLDDAYELVHSEKTVSELKNPVSVKFLTRVFDMDVSMGIGDVDFQAGDTAICFKTSLPHMDIDNCSSDELWSINEQSCEYYLLQFFNLQELLSAIGGAYQHGVSYREFQFGDIIHIGEYE